MRVDPYTSILSENKQLYDLYFFNKIELFMMFPQHRLEFFMLMQVDEYIGRSENFQYPS
jgi:hypothetical protein